MKTTIKKEKARKVDFSFSAPHAECVSIAGDFNDWNTVSHPMKKDKKGIWKTSLSLDPGVYQYNFYVDGEWQNDPNCAEYLENPFGTLNSVKRVE
jgi:1,4-alpha-glucan branching enzyme